MKKLLFILMCFVLLGAAPSRDNTYTSGSVISSSDVTANEDAIFTYLSGGVDTYVAGSVDATAIATSAVTTAEILDSTVADADLADDLTLTGDITIDGTTPSITIGDAGTEDAQLNFDGSAQDWHVGLEDTTDDFSIGLGTTLGTTSHIVIDETGAVTKPLQPGFLAHPASTQDDIAKDGPVAVVLGTERFDTNSDFASNTFTAPITGKYQLNMVIRLDDIDSAATEYAFYILTSNKNYIEYLDCNKVLSVDGDYFVSFSVLADMDVSDTASLQVYQTGGTTGQTDIELETFFSGFLAY